MKRRIVSIFLVLALLSTFAISVHALEISLTEDGDSVYDEANLLTSSEEAEVAEALENLGAKYDTQVVVVTLPELNSDPDEYVEELYDTMGFGYGDNYDGALLMVCMDPREYRILVNGFAADAIDDDAIDYMSDAVATHLSEGDYAYAFLAFAQECDYYLDGYITRSEVNATVPSDTRTEKGPFSVGKTLLSSLVVGIVIGLIVVAVLAGQLKSVKKQNQARDYVKPGSMHLTQRSDTFLYRNVSRVKRDSGSSSSGSRSSSRSSSGSRSSSRHVGSRKF